MLVSAQVGPAALFLAAWLAVGRLPGWFVDPGLLRRGRRLSASALVYPEALKPGPALEPSRVWVSAGGGRGGLIPATICCSNYFVAAVTASSGRDSQSVPVFIKGFIRS